MTPLSGPPTAAPTAPGRLPLIGHAHQLARRPLDFMDSLRPSRAVSYGSSSAPPPPTWSPTLPSPGRYW